MSPLSVSLLATTLLFQTHLEEVTPPPLDTAVVVVSGQVRGTGNTEVEHLAGAVLELQQGERSWVSIADPEGRYRITGPGEGKVRVSAFHLSARPLVVELLLPKAGEVQLDLALEVFPIPLPALVIQGKTSSLSVASASFSPMGSPGQSTLTELSLTASNGMVQSGLSPSLSTPLPGEDPRPPSRTLFTRGSTIDARQFLLDGAPILTPFSLSGLIPSFDAQMIGRADLYVGGAPARYEGGLSHVLDLATRFPGGEGHRGEIALDGVALRGSFEGPLPMDGGFLATGRVLHGGASFLSLGGKHPYGFGDLMVRGELRPGKNHRLSITGFGNRESLDLAEAEEVAWGNRALSLGWTSWIGSTSVGIVSALTHYHASFPIEWVEPLQARSDAYQGRFSLLVRTPWKEGEVQFGSSFERQDFRYLLFPTGTRPSVEQTHIESTPERIIGDRIGAFLEIDQPIGSGGARVRAGGRVDHFGVEGVTRLSPRVSVSYPLTAEALVTLSGGRYHQQIAVPGLYTATGGPEIPEIFWSPNFRVASADHLVLSLDQEVSPEITLGVSGFVKHFQDMLPDRERQINASGTDLRIGWNGDRTEGWVGYTISWFWEEAGAANATTFSGRHLLATGARIRDFHGLSLGFSLGYGSGLPLTAVGSLPDVENFVSGPAGDRTLQRLDRGSRMSTLALANAGTPLDITREESFLRIDLDLAWSRTYRIGERTYEFRPYLRILNALARRDALFYTFDPWVDNELRPLTERPFLPLIGAEWRF